MSLNTLPAEPLPDLPLSVSPEFATRSTDFGDGYTLKAEAGINSKSNRVQLSWTNISQAEYDIVIGFIEAHAPATPFYYTPPNGVQGAYTCEVYTHDQVSAAHYAVTATFEQYHGV